MLRHRHIGTILEKWLCLNLELLQAFAVRFLERDHGIDGNINEYGEPPARTYKHLFLLPATQRPTAVWSPGSGYDRKPSAREAEVRGWDRR